MENIFGSQSEDQKEQGPTYYDVLGCTQHSNTEQIKTEYKVRALQFHPDKNNNDQSSQLKFKQLLEAKETLSDPIMRQKYDQWLNSGGLGMLWKDWLNFTTKNQTVFHWVFQKPDPTLLSNTDNQSNDEKKFNSIPKNHDLKVFRHDSKSDSNESSNNLLMKFRNYNI
jgi:DnaJ family protein C protein 12